MQWWVLALAACRLHLRRARRGSPVVEPAYSAPPEPSSTDLPAINGPCTQDPCLGGHCCCWSTIYVEPAPEYANPEVAERKRLCPAQGPKGFAMVKDVGYVNEGGVTAALDNLMLPKFADRSLCCAVPLTDVVALASASTMQEAGEEAAPPTLPPPTASPGMPEEFGGTTPPPTPEPALNASNLTNATNATPWPDYAIDYGYMPDYPGLPNSSNATMPTVYPTLPIEPTPDPGQPCYYPMPAHAPAGEAPPPNSTVPVEQLVDPAEGSTWTKPSPGSPEETHPGAHQASGAPYGPLHDPAPYGPLHDAVYGPGHDAAVAAPAGAPAPPVPADANSTAAAATPTPTAASTPARVVPAAPVVPAGNASNASFAASQGQRFRVPRIGRGFAA